MNIRDIRLGLMMASVFFSGCRQEPRRVSAAFYHWKTVYAPVPFEKNYLKTLGCNKIYLRLFDVDWSEEDRFPEPVAVANVRDACPYAVTPVIFMTNQAFQRTPDGQVDSLAHLVRQKMDALLRPAVDRFLISRPEEEIQFDCDWTAQTRNKYFSFLTAFKKYSGAAQKAGSLHNGISGMKSPDSTIISATIRLHQVKYFEKTGVPPVDRGVLMCYNTGEVDDFKTENSILQSGAINDYLKNLTAYPLPLDVALPLFSWGVLFRNGEAIKLIDELQDAELDSLPDQFEKKSVNQYEARKNSYFKGRYLYRNDEIRLEKVDVSLLEQTASALSERLPRDRKSFTVIFYHLDEAVVRRYPYEKLENILSRFR